MKSSKGRKPRGERGKLAEAGYLQVHIPLPAGVKQARLKWLAAQRGYRSVGDLADAIAARRLPVYPKVGKAIPDEKFLSTTVSVDAWAQFGLWCGGKPARVMGLLLKAWEEQARRNPVDREPSERNPWEFDEEA